MPKVSVCLNRSNSYAGETLGPLLHEQLDLLGLPGDLSLKKVLLKPNLISAGAPALACSNPLFVNAIADCLLSRGARVLIGDSPAFGTAAHVLKRQGFAAALSGLPVEYISFKTRVVKRLSCGLEVGVAAEALACDYFMNIPKIKAHDQMGVTMAVKNVFGIVLGARKAWLHMKYGKSPQFFAEMILDLQQLLPTTFVLADGLEVMNKRGPMKGSSLLLGCIAASRSGVALDRAMLEVLEIDKMNIPLVMAARKQQVKGAKLEDIDFPQLVPSDFAGSGFRTPAKLIPIPFQPFRYLRSSLKRILSF